MSDRLKIAVAVFSVQLLFALPTTGVYFSLQDEGNILAWASRMLEGQMPYRDFHFRFMPGNALLLSFCFSLFGESIAVARGYFVISLALLAVVIWLLSDRLMPRPWSIFPAICFIAVGGQAWPMLSHHWDANITALAALLLIDRARSPAALIGAGLMSGLTVLMLQPKGVAICLAVGLVALLKAPRGKRLLLTMAGAAIPGSIFVVYLLAAGAFGAFWEQAVLYNLRSYSVFQAYPFDWGIAFQQFAKVGDGLSMLGTSPFGPWLLWFAKALSFAFVDLIKYTAFLPILLMAAALSFKSGEKQELLAGLIVLLSISTYFSWTRATRFHFNFHTPAWYPVLFYLLWQLYLRREVVSRLLTTGVLLTFFVHGLDNVFSWQKYRFPIEFERGRLYSDDPNFARESQALVNSLSKSPNLPVFGFPEVPMVLWLTGRTNPTSFDMLVPFFYPDEQFAQARAELETASPCLILFRPVGASIVGDYPALSEADYVEAERKQYEFITRGAVPQARFGTFYLLTLPRMKPED